MADERVFGSTSNVERFLIQDTSTGAFKLGLTGSTSGLIISTICDTESTATPYTQAASHIQTIATLGIYAAPSASNCRFKEVDSTNHPGLYEFQFADARYSVSNAQRLVISVTGGGAFANYEIALIKAPALASSFTTLFNQMGSITGSGANTLLGYIQAILRKDSTLPSDIGGTYANSTMSLEAAEDNSLALSDFFTVNSGVTYASAIPGSIVYETATNAAQSGITGTPAQRISLAGGQIIPGTVDNAGFSPTTTQFEASNITTAAANTWINTLGIFTSGALVGTRFIVTAYSLVGGRGHFTVIMQDRVTVLPSPPANGVTFVLC